MSSSNSSALSSLLRQASLDDHEKLLEEAQNALSEAPDTLQAQHIKLIALLKLDRFQEASEVVDISGSALKVEAPLAVGYALYKAGRVEEAAKIEKEPLEHSRGLKHLQAQAAYRSEKFSAASQLYSELAQDRAAENNETIDVRVNTSATQAQLLWAGQHLPADVIKALNADLQQFETAYNAACVCLARGHLKQAEFYLARAMELCAGADELSEEEKDIELFSIKAQQLYLLNMVHKSDEAANLAKELDIDSSKMLDSSTKRIAQINTVVCSAQPQNPFMYDRLVIPQNPIDLSDALFGYQETAVRQNTAGLNFLMGKASAVSKATKSLASGHTYPSTHPEVTTSTVIDAAMSCQGHTGKAALKHILKLLKARPTEVGLALTAIQLAHSMADLDTATRLLESFLSRRYEQQGSDNDALRFSPGIVAVLVALYTTSNRSSQAKSELSQAASYWRQLGSAGNVASRSMFKTAATALLRDSTPEELQASHELFNLLHEVDQSNSTLAGQVASSPSLLAQNRQDRLPKVSALVDNVDVVALEKAGIPRLEGAMTKARPQKRAAVEPDSTAKNLPTKKPRKAKMSKPVDPAVQPDPERWLPARDRSNYKAKGKRKGKQVASGMATQGGISEDSRPSTPIASQVLQQSKTTNKKKKKGAR